MNKRRPLFVDAWKVWADLNPRIKVIVRKRENFRIRLALAMLFIELGCRIANMGVGLEEDTE